LIPRSTEFAIWCYKDNELTKQDYHIKTLEFSKDEKVTVSGYILHSAGLQTEKQIQEEKEEKMTRLHIEWLIEELKKEELDKTEFQNPDPEEPVFSLNLHTGNLHKSNFLKRYLTGLVKDIVPFQLGSQPDTPNPDDMYHVKLRL